MVSNLLGSFVRSTGRWFLYPFGSSSHTYFSPVNFQAKQIHSLTSARLANGLAQLLVHGNQLVLRSALLARPLIRLLGVNKVSQRFQSPRTSIRPGCEDFLVEALPNGIRLEINQLAKRGDAAVDGLGGLLVRCGCWFGNAHFYQAANQQGNFVIQRSTPML